MTVPPRSAASPGERGHEAGEGRAKGNAPYTPTTTMAEGQQQQQQQQQPAGDDWRPSLWQVFAPDVDALLASVVDELKTRPVGERTARWYKARADELVSGGNGGAERLTKQNAQDAAEKHTAEYATAEAKARYEGKTRALRRLLFPETVGAATTTTATRASGAAAAATMPVTPVEPTTPTAATAPAPAATTSAAAAARQPSREASAMPSTASKRQFVGQPPRDAAQAMPRTPAGSQGTGPPESETEEDRSDDGKGDDEKGKKPVPEHLRPTPNAPCWACTSKGQTCVGYNGATGACKACRDKKLKCTSTVRGKGAAVETEAVVVKTERKAAAKAGKKAVAKAKKGKKKADEGDEDEDEDDEDEDDEDDIQEVTPAPASPVKRTRPLDAEPRSPPRKRSKEVLDAEHHARSAEIEAEAQGRRAAEARRHAAALKALAADLEREEREAQAAGREGEEGEGGSEAAKVAAL